MFPGPSLFGAKSGSTVATSRDVDLHARAHGRAQGDLLQVLPLAPDGLALTIASTSASKLRAGPPPGRRLADARVDDAGLLDAILDPGRLGVLHGLCDVHGHGHRAGFGIRPIGPSTLPRRPTRPASCPGSRCSGRTRSCRLDDLRADPRRPRHFTGLTGLVGLSALGEHADAHGLTGALELVTTPRTIWSA